MFAEKAAHRATKEQLADVTGERDFLLICEKQSDNNNAIASHHIVELTKEVARHKVFAGVLTP